MNNIRIILKNEYTGKTYEFVHEDNCTIGLNARLHNFKMTIATEEAKLNMEDNCNIPLRENKCYLMEKDKIFNGFKIIKEAAV